MPGRRPKGLRSGDLNEELGILLLKSFAAVAPVPRPEDTGIDAVATLLRDDTKTRLIAENSFFVQLKSYSDRTVEFVDHEVDWVKELKLPFFIGSVCKKIGQIELYSTHRLTEFLINEPPSRIRLHLDEGSAQQISKDAWDVRIGPPILKWKTDVFGDDEFSRHACAIIKAHVVAEQRNIECRSVRYCEKLSWETDKLPISAGLSSSHSGSRAEILAASKAMAPALSALALHIYETRNEEARQVILNLYSVLKKFNIEPDPGCVFAVLGSAWDFPSRLSASISQRPISVPNFRT